MQAKNKYELNQVVFFVHGTQIVKGIIDECVLHYTQKKLIIKYMIRPYGLDKFVTIDEKNMYNNIEDAKKKVVYDLKTVYKKENIIVNYRTAKKQMEEKFEEQLENFDDNLKKAQASITNVSEKYYDDLELKYQQTLKEKNNDKTEK